MEKSEAYTSKVTGRVSLQLQDLIEEHSGELMDSICDISHAYFKFGMKTGAVLLLQLMGF